MKIGRVAGTVVSTISAPIFEHQRLLFCDLLTAAGDPTGDYVIAVDVVDVGAGETVLILDEGSGARQIMGQAVAPIRAVVVGIIDDVDV